jgi:signal transduction histidine kinase
MEPEAIARLFQPFSQVHKVAIAHPGSGLGLYICRAIVELHGGTIEADSQGLGKGSTFTIRLPRQTA